MILLARDVTATFAPPAFTPPLLVADKFVTNPDGTMALELTTGSYAFQQPSDGGDTYGKFGSSPSPTGAYQECKVSGQLVSFWTRGQDHPYVYTWVEVPNR